MSDLEFEERSSTFTTSIVSAPGQSAKGRAWNSAFAGLTQGLMGFYVVTTDEALLKRIVPVSRKSATEARRVFDANSVALENLLMSDKLYCFEPYRLSECVAAREKLANGAGADKPFRGKPGVHQVYFADLDGNGSEVLLLGLERTTAVTSEDPKPVRWLATAVLRKDAPPTVAGGPHFIPQVDAAPLSYERLMHLPRASLALGGCRYMVTGLHETTHLLNLRSMPAPSKRCPDFKYVQRPDTDTE